MEVWLGEGGVLFSISVPRRRLYLNLPKTSRARRLESNGNTAQMIHQKPVETGPGRAGEADKVCPFPPKKSRLATSASRLLGSLFVPRSLEDEQVVQLVFFVREQGVDRFEFSIDPGQRVEQLLVDQFRFQGILRGDLGVDRLVGGRLDRR
ncbi:hypothetical protein Enr8_45770 [Blastopirellula retiformator]|uniref:Uncharacterized protein n=1 Tax=Blastopirellula retiformator TaxID=2527970 RepID=A0A5C5UU77_9BACT|nr:hypothetical protein Enr8_45770 [Blastopirellula retiformator]